MPAIEKPQAKWPSVDRLIPQRPPLLLVERIVRFADGELVCGGVLPACDRSGGTAAPPFLALELAAQTAAVMAALEAGDAAGAGAIGYLAVIRDARFLTPEIPAGRRLLAAVRVAGRMPPLATWAVRVTLEDGAVELLTATLSTYLASGS
jgi:predicted hotdog family 3-hydroxylacyl-ACP dehydratase